MMDVAGKAATKAKGAADERRFLVVTCLALAGLGFGSIFGWQAITNRVSRASLHRGVVTTAGILGLTGIGHSGKSAGHTDWRIVLIDPVTGERRARRVLGAEQPECEETQAGSLWCRTKREVSLLALPTLADRATWADLQRAIPGLAVGIAVGQLERSGESIVVRGNDGRDWELHADPLRGAPALGEARERSRGRRGRSSRTSSAPAPGGTLAFADAKGSQRRSIVLRDVAGDGEARPTACQQTYLEPDFVTPSTPVATPPDTAASDDGGAFVVHKSSLARDASHVLLSRVGADGCPRWTVDLGDGSLELLTHARKVLAVVGSFPRGEGVAIGLDDATGGETWRSPF
jgi:hypothetical protein